MTTETVITLICNAVIIAIAGIVAFYAIRHFKIRTLYDQWMLTFTDKYQKSNITVRELIENSKKDGNIVSKILDNDEIREAVHYILDYYSMRSTNTRFGIVDKKLSIRVAYPLVIYFFENLKPWIEYLRSSEETPQDEVSFSDFEWFYNYCNINLDTIKKSKLGHKITTKPSFR